MHFRSFLAALMLVATIPQAALACSQCMCGMPFPAEALGGVVPMQVRLGIEDRYLSKSNALEDQPGREAEREHRISAFALWRPASRVALLGRVPYNTKEIRETPDGDPTETQSTRGLGDVELLALVGLAQRGGALGAVFGVTAPTGSNDRRDGSGELLDAHLQPGTGGWSATVGLNLGVPLARGSFEAGVLARVNRENSHGYRYGNAWLYNAGYTTPERHGVSFLAQVNGRTAARDRFEDASLGENTGGTVIYAAPGLRWRSGAGLAVEALVQVPVIESLYGEQDEHTVGRVALSMSR